MDNKVKEAYYLNKSGDNIVSAVLKIEKKIDKNSEEWKITSNLDVGKDFMNLVVT